MLLVENIEGTLKDNILAAFTDEAGEIDQAALDTASAESDGTIRSDRKRFVKAIRRYLALRSRTQP
jgi:hypothetical protein